MSWRQISQMLIAMLVRVTTPWLSISDAVLGQRILGVFCLPYCPGGLPKKERKKEKKTETQIADACTNDGGDSVQKTSMNSDFFLPRNDGGGV